jgi:hypothetical protein
MYVFLPENPDLIVHITLALHSALHAFAGVRVKNLNF